MIFDLYAVVTNFAVNYAHTLIGPFSWWLFLFLCLSSIYSLSSYESESLDDEYEKSCFLCFWRILFLSRFLILDLL